MKKLILISLISHTYFGGEGNHVLKEQSSYHLKEIFFLFPLPQSILAGIISCLLYLKPVSSAARVTQQDGDMLCPCSSTVTSLAKN